MSAPANTKVMAGKVLLFASGDVNFLTCEPTRRFWPVRVKPQRFRVRATRPDGHTTHYTAIGGTSCGHLVDAMDLAGLGGVVSVQPLQEADAA